MAKVSNIFVSTVFIADDRVVDVAGRVSKIANTLRQNYANYEVLIIDNGLLDAELQTLQALLPKVPCLRVVRLSKSYSVDTALFAGVEASIGDFVCTLYDNDPIELITEFVKSARSNDIVLGVAQNLQRKGLFEELGAKIFYWYSKRYLKIDIPNGSTYFICMNRSAANALTRSGRAVRHIRHMSKRVGFNTTTYNYDLPEDFRLYSRVNTATLTFQAIDLVSNYSSHPLRVVTYFGISAGLLNIAYAVYVLVINFSQNDVAKGWTTLSLQSSIMFFILFMILAILAEYIGKILNETQKEPPYHLMQELSSTISVADETRRNVKK